MESILTLLRRLWQPEQLEAESFIPASEEQDRSSMADLVRILQEEDQGDASGQQ
jgi:hypothetical protein